MINWAAIIAAAGITSAVWLLWLPKRWSLLSGDAGVTELRGASLILRPAYLMGLVAGAGFGWVMLGGLGLLAGAAAGIGVGRWLEIQVPSADAKKQQHMVREFPLVLGFLASVVESGAPVRFAAESVCQVIDGLNADRLRGVVARCDVGFTDAEAWRTLAKDPVWGDVAIDLARCVDTGAATGEVLRSAAKHASKAAAAEAITQARSVGVSSTLPLICCFLPAFLLVGVVPIIGGLISNYITGF